MVNASIKNTDNPIISNAGHNLNPLYLKGYIANPKAITPGISSQSDEAL
jgi:hypothetical protein